MESFHITIITIAVIILIIILTVIGIMMTNKTYDSSVFPPSKNTCPDYWEVITGGNCRYTVGKNTGHTDIGTMPDVHGHNNGAINFNDAGWTSNGGTALCNQKDWALKYGISWDGVANYNGCK